MKKVLVSDLVIIVALSALAWFKRIDLMLALVKFKSDREYVVAPNRPVAWEQGPAVAHTGRCSGSTAGVFASGTVPGSMDDGGQLRCRPFINSIDFTAEQVRLAKARNPTTRQAFVVGVEHRGASHRRARRG